MVVSAEQVLAQLPTQQVLSAVRSDVETGAQLVPGISEVGYSVVDFNTNDTNNDGAISLPELTHWFGNISQHPQTALKLAHQWLAGHDVNNDQHIDLTEHTASVLLDTNANGYLEADTPTKTANAYYTSTGYSTTQQRDKHHAAMFKNPQQLKQTLSTLINTLDINGWLQAFGLNR